ncbi:MAG: DNA polymerase III subunit beta [Hydrococcus sp. C42_A2020_068]|uniref:DNA polymerase III subunit beta n=1 Tax=Pleurocapsa sp. PCC 7327 TaxID=118163 RepID=UPI00029F96B1|nr:DNA polymerase III subunit beta [Pleurocapsa sp. PCC 7327]AFY75495.1 DNA polymerase III, beta subunit [Pleurocapsa sp. PCC 7327]MBF2021336.1 DNA polymerase III subunit beta [Hydrococcus sp. C42_A2020_068]
MKFTCSQSDLNANLSLVSRAVPSRPTYPVLGNVLFVADAQGKRVSLTAFDSRLGIRTNFSAEVSEGGRLTLPAKILNDIVARLPEEEITLAAEDEEEENPLATLTSSSGRFQIRGMSATEFPELPKVEEGEGIVLPVSALSDGLKGTLFAASTDETKQVLTGVHLAGSQDSLEFAATDGHRLAVVETPLENTEVGDRASDNFAVTIAARALRELERMLATAQATDSVALYVDESQTIFELGDRRLTSLKLEGAYPAYQQLIPRQFSRTVTVERKRLIGSLERVAVLADQKNNLVKFTIDRDRGQLSLSVESQDLGSAKESMSAEITGDSLEIAFNIKYLMDGLKALPSSDIQMQLNEGNQPVIVTPLGGLKMTYLVMPVQILR